VGIQNLLPEMTKEEKKLHWWVLSENLKHNRKAKPASPHVYTRDDNQEKIVVTMTYAECFARSYSTGCRQSLAILLADGVEAYYDEEATNKMLYGNRGIAITAGNWPMESYALGVPIEDVPEMMKKDRAADVPTNYNDQGEPIFTSKTHRRKYCKLHEFHDRNGGYSDP